MQETSYNNIQLSSNQLLTNLGSVLSDDQINQLAKDKKLVFRSRLFSPAIFLRTAVEILNRDKEYSLRSIYYKYADNSAKEGLETLSWEPFYDFIDKKQMPIFLDAIKGYLDAQATKGSLSNSQRLVEVLKLKIPSLTDIAIQDGSEVACNCKVFKGKITNEAKIHRLLSLNSFTELHSTTTSGVSSERAEIDLSKLANKLFLADAGYPKMTLFKELHDNQSLFIIKLKSGSALKALSYKQYNADSTVTDVKSPVNKYGAPLKLKDEAFKDGLTRDFIVDSDEFPSLRVVAVFNKDEKKYVYFATNIEQHLLDAFQIAALYRARWQVEISFRILKGFCSLKKCNTHKEGIVRSLITLSQIVYLLKMIIGQQLQQAFAVELSPKKLVQRIKCHFMDIIQFVRTLDSDGLLSYLTSREKLFRTYGKSAPSLINRIRGKSLSLIIDEIRRPSYDFS